MSFFKLIVPCGLHGCRVTSVAEVLNNPIEIGSVLEPVIQSFCQVFEMEPLTVQLDVPELLVN